jgi:hypothetical protein
MKWNKILLCLLLGILSVARLGIADAGSGWLIYHESSFKGRVIDAETKEPIEGAVVVAQYHVNMLGPTGSHTTLIDVQEALTDKKGEFYLPSLTKVINPFSTGYDTSFLIWKPAYKGENIWGGYFFAKEPGTVENRPVHAEGGLVLRPVRLGIVELEPQRSFDERKRNIPSLPSWDDFLEKQSELLQMINNEEVLLGLQRSDPSMGRNNTLRGK